MLKYSLVAASGWKKWESVIWPFWQSSSHMPVMKNAIKIWRKIKRFRNVNQCKWQTVPFGQAKLKIYLKCARKEHSCHDINSMMKMNKIIVIFICYNYYKHLLILTHSKFFTNSNGINSKRHNFKWPLSTPW